MYPARLAQAVGLPIGSFRFAHSSQSYERVEGRHMKILVAHDGSRHGTWAMEWLGELPLMSTPTVTIVHVDDVASLQARFMPQPDVWASESVLQEELKQWDARATKTMAEAEQFLMRQNLQGKVVRVQGAIGATILDTAPRRDGLVMMGSRGLGTLDRALLGSVSTRVTLHAPCSVLVVKEKPRPLNRILFATDGSKAAEKALQFLVAKLMPQTLNQRGKRPIEVVLVHALPFLNYPELKEAGSRLLEESAGPLMKAGYTVDGMVRLGKPANEVLTIAAKAKVDLIVTGAKGMGAIARFLLGSVSTEILHRSRCSVLVVR